MAIAATCLDERMALRRMLRCARESLLHLSLHPRDAQTIARARETAELLGEQATWQDQGDVTRLAGRMASILRDAALGRHGVATSGLADLRRQLSAVIAQAAT